MQSSTDQGHVLDRGCKERIVKGTQTMFIKCLIMLLLLLFPTLSTEILLRRKGYAVGL